MPSRSSRRTCTSTMSSIVTSGKPQPVGAARRRVDAAGPGGAGAARRARCADDEVPLGVDRLARARPSAPTSPGRGSPFTSGPAATCESPTARGRSGRRSCRPRRARRTSRMRPRRARASGPTPACEAREQRPPAARTRAEPAPTAWRARWCARHRLHLLERLLQVGEDVADVLDAHREPHEVRADPGAHELLVGQLGVRGRSRVDDERLRVADVREVAEQLAPTR